MPAPRKIPMKDSITENPRVKRALTLLVATGAVKNNQKSNIWYGNLEYAEQSAKEHPLKFHKIFSKLLRDKYGEQARNKIVFCILFFSFSKIFLTRLAVASASNLVRNMTELLREEDKGYKYLSEDDDNGYFDEKQLRGGSKFGSELIYPSIEYKYLCSMRNWTDPSTKDDRVSISLLIPTGVSVAYGDVKAEVVDEWFLKDDNSCPKFLTDVSTLTAMWLEGDGSPKESDCHRMISEFHEHMQKFQKQEG